MILLFFATPTEAPTYPEAYAYLWRQSMNLTRKVSTTTYPIVFMMVDSTDHVTGETGLTPTVTLSKNGGGYAAAAGAVSEIANGLYALAGNATDRDTLGELWVHADGGAGVDKADFKVDIVSHDPYGDLSTVKAITDQFVFTVANQVDANALSGGGSIDAADIRAAVGLSTANLDTQLSTIDSEIGTIYSEMASVDDVLTPLAVVDGIVDAIKVQTDKIPATPASAGEYTAAIAAIPTAPLLAANYVAPDNVTIGEIKAKTDNIPAAPLTAQQVWEYVTRELTSQGSGGATAQEVWEYATRVLTAGTNIDLTPLAKTTHLQEVEDKVDGIKGITDQLTFTVPNKVDASATVDPTGIATSEELDIIGEKVDGVLNKLNVSSVEFVTAVVGSNITILRGDTLAARLLDLGDLTQYASLDFTVKRVAGELDDAAKIRLRKNASGTDDGLLRINGAEYATATDGSIVIDDLTTGDIEIKLNAAATRELVPGNYVYDVQLIIANEVRTLTAGKLEVVADVTRAVA
jgi:hypothetical protein